jgi:aminocarboxymuconate-semialdehyde decarboxylase
LHDPDALNYLKHKMGVARILLGTDDSFPPADPQPLKSLEAARFSDVEIAQICEDNPRSVFQGLNAKL